MSELAKDLRRLLEEGIRLSFRTFYDFVEITLEFLYCGKAVRCSFLTSYAEMEHYEAGFYGLVKTHYEKFSDQLKHKPIPVC